MGRWVGCWKGRLLGGRVDEWKWIEGQVDKWVDDSKPSRVRTQEYTTSMAESPQQWPPDDGSHREFHFPSQSAVHLLILSPIVPESVLTLMEQGKTPGAPARMQDLPRITEPAFTQTS